MNNKGFAIIGILYTILILFLMIMLSVLAGLNTRKNFMEKSISSFQDDYLGDAKNSSYVYSANSSKTAPVTGKYVFSNNSSDNSLDNSLECYAYLKAGDNFKSKTLLCGNEKQIWSDSFSVIEIYEFK